MSWHKPRQACGAVSEQSCRAERRGLGSGTGWLELPLRTWTLETQQNVINKQR